MAINKPGLVRKICLLLIIFIKRYSRFCRKYIYIFLIQNFRFRWNSGIPFSRSTTKRSIWKSCRYLGVRGYSVYSFGWLSAFLGRGSTPLICTDQSGCLRFSLSWVGYSHSRRQKSNKPGKKTIQRKICFLFLKRLYDLPIADCEINTTIFWNKSELT